MKINRFIEEFPRFRRCIFLALVLCVYPMQGRADTASVVTAANTYLSVSGQSTTTYSLATDKQWTNLPGGTRNGPTIGGGALATSTDISTTARTAALRLSTDALSTAGYNTMNEIRLADDVIRSSAAGSGQSWNYSNYHIATLGTPVHHDGVDAPDQRPSSDLQYHVQLGLRERDAGVLGHRAAGLLPAPRLECGLP